MKLPFTIKKPRAVFCVTVDWTYNAKSERKKHQSNENSLESDTFARAERIVMSVMLEDLPRDVNELYGFEIALRHLGTRGGSLLLFYEVIASGLGAISSYADFVDSMNLIRTHAKRLLDHGLERERDLEIGVRCEWPNCEGEERYLKEFYGRGSRPLPFLVQSESRAKRDGFFYFLLCLCIIQAALIYALLYVAVKKTYFGPNQSSEPTTRIVTPAAGQPARQP